MPSCSGALRTAAIAAVAVLTAHFAIACGSGSGPSEDSPQSRAAIAGYRSYLEEDSALLVRAIQALLAEIEDGDLPRAQSRYARARVRYAEVEPLASTFGKLNSSIDARVGEVPESELRGFHRIEQTLFAKSTTAGMTPVTRRLLDDARELERRFGTTDLKAAQIAAGASNALTWISTSALAGREERYAHIDVVDVAAGVEGVEAAFEAVKPLLAADEGLPKEVEAQLEKLYATVGEYGTLAREADQQRALSPGVSFVIFIDLPQSEVDEIRQQVDELAQLLSEAQDQISGS
jgi:iron uptake system component EfeO